MFPSDNIVEKEIIYNDKSLIIILFPYSPFKEFHNENADVSAYYIASNKAYKYTKDKIRKLREQGYENADFIKNVSWKEILVSAGIAWQGKNTLAYTKEFGSYFVIMIITKDGQITDSKPIKINNDKCKSCDLCIKACPAGAIKKDSFNPDICIRHHMIKGTCEDDFKKLFGKKLIGCDLCQSVCPHNIHIGAIDVPESIQNLFNIKRLLNLSINTDRKTLDKIAELIGANLSRANYLSALACIVAGNTEPKKYITELTQLINHSDSRISGNARFYYKNEF